MENYKEKDVFPELKENEDDRIRNNAIQIISSLMNGVDVALPLSIYKECIAWLEKQVEIVKEYEDKLDRVSCESFDKGYKAALEQQCDQKPADKVEPKFKAGDFIADGKRVFLVLANEEERNLDETYSRYCEGLVLDVYGDVLVDDKDFSGFMLATDIERANFVHDLKVGTKINCKPAEWSEEDERMLDSIIEEVMPCGECPDYPTDEEREYFYEGNRKVEWLKSLKERMKGE